MDKILQSKDKVVKGLKKYKTHVYTANKRLTSNGRTHTLKERGWKKTYHASGNQKKMEWLYSYQTKINFK